MTDELEAAKEATDHRGVKVLPGFLDDIKIQLAEVKEEIRQLKLLRTAVAKAKNSGLFTTQGRFSWEKCLHAIETFGIPIALIVLLGEDPTGTVDLEWVETIGLLSSTFGLTRWRRRHKEDIAKEKANEEQVLTLRVPVSNTHSFSV